MCLCVEVLAHGHICIVMSECVESCMHKGLSLCACVCMCVCAPKRALLNTFTWAYVSACLLAQVPSHGGGVAWPWKHDTRDAELAVPAHLGGGPVVELTGDGMGLGCLGLQAHRLQGLQSVGLPGAPQKHWRNRLDSGLGEGQCSPGHCPVTCSLPSLIPTPWLESPLSSQIQGRQRSHNPTEGGEAPAVADPSLWVGHPCPAFPPSQFLCAVVPSQF